MGNVGKLPLWETFIGSYGFVWKHWRDLIRIGWLPLLLVFLAALYFGSFDMAGAKDPDLAAGGQGILEGLVGALVQGAISVFLLVSWHRLVMREYRAAGDVWAKASLVTFGRRGAVYFLQMLLLSIIFLVIFLVASFVAEILLVFGYLLLGGDPAMQGGAADMGAIKQNASFVVLGYLALLIGMFPAFYTSLRLSLALPETATADVAGRLSHSWAVSAGNGWRMVFATILVMLPVETFNLGFGFLASASVGNELHYPLVLLTSAGLVILMALLGTVLSRCYAFLQYGSARGAGLSAAPVEA